MVRKFAQGYALFIAWFNGICALVCGLWMMLSALTPLPLSWNDLMPITLLGPLPLPAFMKTNFFWPGIALALINGVPNIIALIARTQGNPRGFYTWGIIAGTFLILWTIFEMLFIPNGISAFYMVLGILQLIANLFNRRDID